MTPGIYVCTYCDAQEVRDREVTCWVCGKGEMIWTADPLPFARRQRPSPPDDDGDLPWD